MKYQFIKDHRFEFPVQKMCQILGLSRSGFYEWRNRTTSIRDFHNRIFLILIKEIFESHKKRYGSPRISDELKDMGYKVGHNRIARIMRKNNIKAKYKRKFKPKTTDSNHNFPYSENLLEQNFSVSDFCKAWASDITYIPTLEGWKYLCVIMDLYNREIIGWSLRADLETEIVTDAFDMAIKRHHGKKGIIFHSDRGVQYASTTFRKRLSEKDFLSSMSAKGNCYDNAPVESFFHTLKMEEVYRNEYQNIYEVEKSISDYIDYYNAIRKHSYLHYKSPLEYRLRKAA